jgi:adenosylmethionine-8-amino-7-oxononanoate aminotransferase
MAIQNRPKSSVFSNLFRRRSRPLESGGVGRRDLPLVVARREGEEIDDSMLQSSAKEHLWLHFARHSPFQKGDMGIIVRGEGNYIWDSKGNRLLDGLAGLFTVQAGHGRKRIADAAAKQMMELDFFPLWSYAHPRAIELAERVLSYAPREMNRVFFTTGGGEAVETAWKVAKQYFKLTGKPTKTKVISRMTAYHGTSHGALSITGIAAMKAAFEPLVPSTFRVPNTNWYRAPGNFANEEEFALWAANRVEEAILFEGPDTVAAFFVEPIQNSGGCFTAPKSYFKRVREICDKYDVILVADETITGFGRSGHMFASERYEIHPDMMITAKGITSGYAPLGALLTKEKFFEPFKEGTNLLPHGYTFAAHPVSCAIALENLDIFDEERLVENVNVNSPIFRKTLEQLHDLPIVGDIRGDGYFFAIELVKDKATKETFTKAESEKLLRGFLSKALYDAGLYCRADDRGDPVVQLAPPLTIGPKEFVEIEQTLRTVLTEAWRRL